MNRIKMKTTLTKECSNSVCKMYQIKKLFPLLVVMLLFACENSEPRLLSEQEYLKFGKRIEKYMKSGEAKKIAKLFYSAPTYDKLEQLIDTSSYQSSVSDSKWKSYRIEMKQDFTAYVETIANLVQYEGQVEISKYYEKEGKAHLVFSVLSNSNAIEFTDFELLTLGEQTYITDYDSYNIGIKFSDSFIWNALNKLEFGWRGGEYIDALNELKNAHLYLRREQAQAAWMTINRIPDYFQYQSNFQVLKVKIASQISDSLYANSLYNWIAYNYDQEGFRHLKAYQYYSYFRDTTEANYYLDSLEMVAGESFLTEKLRKQIN